MIYLRSLLLILLCTVSPIMTQDDAESESFEEQTEELVSDLGEEEPTEDVVEEESTTIEEEPASEETAAPVITEEKKVAPELPIAQPTVPTKQVVVAEEAKEFEGIHTVDLNEPEGNWLFKRIWWEKSKELFGKIRDLVDKIVESRMHFFEERVKLERERLDPFYVTIGFDQGALNEAVDHLIELLKIDRAKAGTLSGKELEQYNILIEEKKNLEQLRVAVADVQQLKSGVDDAFRNLMEQVNRARSYEREAWRLLNEIAEELSDKRAREHYYEIATIWRNVKDIGNYITGPFAKHFVQLASNTLQRMDQIQTALDSLKTKGVILSKQIEATHETSSQEEQEPEEPEEEQVQLGWLAWLWQKITGLFRWW